MRLFSHSCVPRCSSDVTSTSLRSTGTILPLSSPAPRTPLCPHSAESLTSTFGGAPDVDFFCLSSCSVTFSLISPGATNCATTVFVPLYHAPLVCASLSSTSHARCAIAMFSAYILLSSMNWSMLIITPLTVTPHPASASRHDSSDTVTQKSIGHITLPSTSPATTSYTCDFSLPTSTCDIMPSSISHMFRNMLPHTPAMKYPISTAAHLVDGNAFAKSVTITTMRFLPAITSAPSISACMGLRPRLPPYCESGNSFSTSKNLVILLINSVSYALTMCCENVSPL